MDEWLREEKWGFVIKFNFGERYHRYTNDKHE